MEAFLKRGERGAAIIEFALVAVLLFTIMIGLMEFSRMWFLQAQVAAAARDGARTMAVKNDTSLAVAAVQGIFPSATSADISVTPATGGCDAGGPATVTVTYNADFMTGFFDPLLGSEIPLKGEGVMRCGG